MRTAIIILCGLAAWAFCVLLAHRYGKPGGTAVADATLGFVTVWFLSAATYMWIGMTRVGYSWRDELPVVGLIFGVPAGVAMIVKRRFH